MGLFSPERKKRTPLQIQARLKKQLEKKAKLADAKEANRKLREKIAKLG
jgi:hypothetical protein